MYSIEFSLIPTLLIKKRPSPIYLSGKSLIIQILIALKKHSFALRAPGSDFPKFVKFMFFNLQPLRLKHQIVFDQCSNIMQNTLFAIQILRTNAMILMLRILIHLKLNYICIIHPVILQCQLFIFTVYISIILYFPNTML